MPYSSSSWLGRDGVTCGAIEVLESHVDGLNSRICLKVKLANLGQSIWLDNASSSGGVTLALRQGIPGAPGFREAQCRRPIPKSLSPGEELVISAVYALPEDYETAPWHLDLVNEGLYWFSQKGWMPAELKLEPESLKAKQIRDPKDLHRFEKRVHSQNGEDGIIQELLRRIGPGSKSFVEFGGETGIECNCARLVFEEDWTGLFMEADTKSFQQLCKRYRDRRRVRCIQAQVTSANIEALLAANNVPQDLDLLSIDIDGNDYWVWKAIKQWHPRIVVIEYNASFPPPQKWVMKENPDHQWNGTNYFGASLTSLATLGRNKGYTLVATTSNGVNAFFVRTDVTNGAFFDPEVAFHFSGPRYGPEGKGHPPGAGPFVEI